MSPPTPPPGAPQSATGPATVTVAGIIRASSLLQGREGKESIPRQRTCLDESALRLGLSIIKTYTLIDVSGGDLDRTPEWQQIVDLLAAGVIQGVVVDNVDRLLRATEWNFKVYADLAAHGAKIWTPDGAKDPGDPTDTLMLGIYGLLGGHEKMKMARASWLAREEKRKRGEWAASCKALPTGIAYDKKTKVWSLTPEIAEVRDVFRRFATGESQNSICLGTGRVKSVIAKWLHDPIYSGWMVRTHKQRGGPKIRRPGGRQPRRRAIAREPHEVIRVQVFKEPPVPIERWEAAQRRLSSGKTTYQRRAERVPGSHAVYPLRGVLFCACGQAIFGNSRRRGDGKPMPLYGCRVKLQGRLSWMMSQNLSCESGMASVDAVHTAVLAGLARKFKSPRYIKELVDATMAADARRANEGVAGRLAALQRKLAGLEKEKPRLLDLYKRDIIPIEELEVDRRKLDREIAATKELIAGLGHSPEEVQEKEDLLRDLIGDVVELGEVLDAIRSGDIATLAEALRASGSTVFVHIGKGRNAPIKVTGVELRVADLSSLAPAIHKIRGQQYAHPCRHPRYGLTL